MQRLPCGDRGVKQPWKTAWIIGASQGMGRALALTLAELGVRVAASARDRATLEDLSRNQANLEAWPLDVTDQTRIEQVHASILEAYGGLDLAVLNAGIYEPMPGGIGPAEEFARHMQVNYLGLVNSALAILPAMRERGAGQLAIVASVAGYRGLPKAAAYGPTKAALINFAEVMRLEMAGSGVDVRLINPGFVATRLTDKNDFRMPSLITTGQAAEAILSGLRGSAFEISFPRGFVSWMKLARMLPYAWYFPLISRMTRS